MKPDLVFYNAHILTMDPRYPRAEGLVIHNGRIGLVGSSQKVLAQSPKGAMKIDLSGRTVTPGLHDAHVHLLGYGRSLLEVHLGPARSLSQALELALTRARELAPGEWLLGHGWDANTWHPPRRPDRHDLDRVIPDRPVALYSKDGHSLWLNSCALQLCGIVASTPDPPGGQILREADGGTPNGILTERACEIVKAQLPASSARFLERAITRAIAQIQRSGITGIHNCEGSETLAVLQDMEARGMLWLRVWHMIPLQSLDAARTLGIRTGFGSPMLRIGHIKMFADGALGSGTAEMLAPYEDEPSNRGVAATSTEELFEAVRAGGEAGLASAIHAIGDAANKRVLDIYEQLFELSQKRGLRQRIEHVQLLTPDDIPRFAKLGIIASMQPKTWKWQIAAGASACVMPMLGVLC